MKSQRQVVNFLTEPRATEDSETGFRSKPEDLKREIPDEFSTIYDSPGPSTKKIKMDLLSLEPEDHEDSMALLLEEERNPDPTERSRAKGRFVSKTTKPSKVVKVCHKLASLAISLTELLTREAGAM